MFRKNVASQFICFTLVSTTDGSNVTGATVTVRRCIDGTFAAGGGTVTEDGSGAGFYKYAMTQADTNGNNISFRFAATGAVSVCVNIVTTDLNPYDAVRAGLTALPNAAAEAAGGLYTRGTGAGQINQPANGMIDGNVVRWLGTACASPSVAGVPEVDITHVDGFVNGIAGAVPANVLVVDSVALATHGAGYFPADVRQFGGSAGTFASGRAEVNVSHFGGSAGTFASGRPEVNMSHISGSAVSTSTAQIGVNVVNFGGSAGTFASGRAEVNVSHFGGTAGTFASGRPEVNATHVDGFVGAGVIIADSILGRNLAGGLDGGRTIRDALRALRNKTSLAAGVLTVYQEDDSTTAWTAAVTQASRDPITSIDPA